MQTAQIKLTPQESRIIRLLVEGLTQKEMALELACAPQTVKFHLRNLRIKINVVSTYQVVAVAIEQGWAHAPKIN
jgi:DNA-binding CsgD family transcriptional regulator